MSLFRVVRPFFLFKYFIFLLKWCIFQVSIGRNPVTSHLVNGYICRAISAFCENLTSHSFAVPDYQSKNPKFTTFAHPFIVHMSTGSPRPTWICSMKMRMPILTMSRFRYIIHYFIYILIILRVTSIILRLTVNTLDPLPPLVHHIILQWI